MSGRRVYEVAKELGLPSRELLKRLREMGVEVKSHSSTISEEVVARLRDGSAPQAPAPVEAAPAAPEAAAVPEPPAPAAAGEAPAEAPAEAVERPALVVHRGVTVKDFAERLGVPAPEVIKVLMRAGSMKTITQSMSDEEILVVADELGAEVEIVAPDVEEKLVEAAPPAPEVPLEPRPPVVTVMGHVDHGKTTVLDRIRQTNVAAAEFGGITQHIGAYQVEKDGHRITFIDTPGHEAFTAMRARGAQVTDIAVLVVAADDGVMPQTIEAIDHARAAGVPIVVAVNKVDKPEADPVRVRTQLSELGLQPQEWGGETLFVDMSAKQGTGIDDLLTAITLVAEELDLKAPRTGPARGVILEAHLDRGRGPVGTVLVQAGTLRVGDAVVAGAAWGKVRAMLDENGRPLREAEPARPVLVTGWDALPQAGDEVRVVADERQARQLAQERDAARRAAALVSRRRVASLEELLAAGERPELNLILKADVQGSLEALSDALSKIRAGDVRLNILHRGVGAVTESDVALAKASRAIVVGFGVRPDAKAREAAEAEGVEIRTYRVIYEALEDIEQALRGLLAPQVREVVLGTAEVRQTFRVPRGVVAGCYVTSGSVVRNAQARLVRDGSVVYEGRIASLRRFKDDVREVQQGFECGIGLEGFNDIKVGDVIEAYEQRQVLR